jgi:hypothetical protein
VDAILGVLFKILTIFFVVGWIGCAITIPICAWKFFSVLFEKDPPSHVEVLPDYPEQKQRVS